MKIAIPSMICLAIFTAICSYFKLAFVPYVVTLSVVVTILLVYFKKIPQNTYPIYLIGLSLSMLWQQTMIGTYILGTDIHQEYFMANKAIESGWDWSYYSLNGTSIILNIISPFLYKIGIPVVWQFKLLFPMILSIVPWILYLAFSKQMDKRYAFYSVIFFMIVPVFTVEISTIIKSMFAELFLALSVLILFSQINYLKKTLYLIDCGIMACLCHYTIGTLLIGYLGIIGIILIGYKIFSHKNNYIPIVIAAVVICAIGLIWFANTGGGIVYKGYANSLKQVDAVVISSKNLSLNIDQSQSESVPKHKACNYLESQDSLVRTALGMDWNQTSISGKAFRVIQYITQLAIILGVLFLFLKRKQYKFSIEFIVGLIASVIILGMVLLVPKVASIINTTRWYHSALFFASPLLVIGLLHIGKEKLVVGVLVIYYFFTSGLVFSLTNSDIPKLTLESPYSVAYCYRQGVIGIFNQDDINCAKWLVENTDNKLTHAGFTDMYLMLGYVEYAGQFVENSPNETHYLFLSSQNIKLQKMSLWSEPGMRMYVPLPDTKNMQEVYRSGESVIYYGR